MNTAFKMSSGLALSIFLLFTFTIPIGASPVDSNVQVSTIQLNPDMRVGESTYEIREDGVFTIITLEKKISINALSNIPTPRNGIWTSGSWPQDTVYIFDISRSQNDRTAKFKIEVKNSTILDAFAPTVTCRYDCSSINLMVNRKTAINNKELPARASLTWIDGSKSAFLIVEISGWQNLRTLSQFN